MEPFAGSAVISLNIPNDRCSVIVNDINRNIYSLYTVLMDAGMFAELRERLDLAICHEEFFREYRERLKDDSLSTVERAFYFFVYNRLAFNGVGGFVHSTCIRRKMSKSTSDLLSAIEGLYQIHQRMSTFIIFGRNGIDLIGKYDRPDVFIYADPPYTHDTRTSARYQCDMSMEEQKRLMEVIVHARAKILLSGYDNPLYGKFLTEENGWVKTAFNVNTVSAKKGGGVKLKRNTCGRTINPAITPQIF
jgi:DNA adenine methylase